VFHWLPGSVSQTDPLPDKRDITEFHNDWKDAVALAGLPILQVKVGADHSQFNANCGGFELHQIAVGVVGAVFDEVVA
jgi:hypothetical protein